MQNFEGKENHGLVYAIFRRIITPQKSPAVVVQHKKNPAWAIKKQRVERGKRAVHFRCFLRKTLKPSRNRG